MILGEAALAVLVMVLTGLAIFRSVARRLLNNHWSDISENDLLLIGVLPGLALVGGLATYLSLLHLLRPVFIAVFDLVLLYILRRHVYAIVVALVAIVADAWAKARRGNLFPVIAIGGCCVLFAAALMLCRVPSGNVDVWVFHIPLAQSLAAHHGIVFPQLDTMPFYANQPIFFEQLYALVMLAAPEFVAAGAVNIAILFGFIFLLLSFARHARVFEFFILCYIFLFWQTFALSGAEPMTDFPRSCFSAGAYLFAYRYASRFRCFDLVMAALMAGAAVAGKYTELVTPLFIGLAIAPLMINKRHIWFHVIPAALIFIAICGVWYAKNLLLLGNPVYPFLFGHPGISDQWMTDYMREMTRSFSVEDRGYSTNLATVGGWQDFLIVLWTYFRQFEPFAVIAAFGLLLPLARRWLMPLWTVLLFVFWYSVMFNGVRWAQTAVLMLLASSVIVWFSVADRIAMAWNPRWPAMLLEFGARRFSRLSSPLPVVAGLLLVLFTLFSAVRLKEGHGHSFRSLFVPSWMDREMALAVLSPAGMDHYLADTKPGYAMYRYIGEHNLSFVLQPFDNGAVSYASAYNGGHSNDWVLPYSTLPESEADTDAFVSRNGIHFFIDQVSLNATARERLGGADRVALARAVVARLKRRSVMIFNDGHGMLLFQISSTPQ